jgi:hypothetical protein
VRAWPVLGVVAAAAVVAVVAVERGAPGSADVGPLPAVTRDGWLVRVDSRTLAPAGRGRVRLPGSVGGWARSPDGSGLVVADRRGARLRFFDVARMRALGELYTGTHGAVAAVAWPAPDRVWLVLARPGCCATGDTTVVTIDAQRRRVVARRDIEWGLVRVAATPAGPVLLLSPTATIGATMVSAVDRAGQVHPMPLRIAAGLQGTEGVPVVLRTRQPGLAVDPERRRAYVVSDRSDLLEVDLRTRQVHYHGLSPYRSVLDRLRDLFEARAEAQPPVGPLRSARWLPPATIAVAGRDAHVSWRRRGTLSRITQPAGLQLIDARRWDVRTPDEHATRLHVVGELVLGDGRGFTGYRSDGDRAFRLFNGERTELVASAGSLAYVRAGEALHVVDLDAGRIVATPRAPWPRLLADPPPGPWG